MNIHSPFIVREHFLSPARCEAIVNELGLLAPSLSDEDEPLKNERIIKDDELAELLKGKVRELVPTIEKHYEAGVVGMEPPHFLQYFENPSVPGERHGCENASYLRKKWVKTKDVDLVGYLWLKDFHNGVPLDPSFEVYGGKLEFPAYNFSLVPQRGTLVLFPAGPHFITAVSPVLFGSLEQIKLSIRLRVDGDQYWFYNPANFPGTFQEWFSLPED